MAKKQYVADMFNNIAPKYDFLNHFFSLGIDRIWRKRMVNEICEQKPKQILDVATGTGDLAIEMLKTNAKKIVGIDISEVMLEQGFKKVRERNVADKIELKLGDCECLNFPNNYFDVTTVAFGVRNFENLDKGIAEIYRTLKPGGTVAILEFSLPKNYFVRKMYSVYFFYILPFFGQIFSKNKYAYKYLPKSVKTFPKREEFLQRLSKNGFVSTHRISLSFGIAEIYFGNKKTDKNTQ